MSMSLYLRMVDLHSAHLQKVKVHYHNYLIPEVVMVLLHLKDNQPLHYLVQEALLSED
jgi:hypothetical protein